MTMKKKDIIEALKGLDDDADVFVSVKEDCLYHHIEGYGEKVTGDDAQNEITFFLD